MEDQDYLVCECGTLFNDYGTYLKCPECGDIVIKEDIEEDEYNVL